MTSVLRDAGLDALNLFFPRRCCFCGIVLERGACICADCFATVMPIEGETCGRCGAPLLKEAQVVGGARVGGKARDGSGELVCGGETRGRGTPFRRDADAAVAANGRGRGCPQCDDLRLAFERNESFGVFQGVLRELIHLYKFGKRRSLHRLFTELLVEAKMRFISGHDLIAPVPLARERALERGYNQSFLVAKGIAGKMSMPFYGEVLVRKGASKPQSGIRTRRERLQNVTDRIWVGKKAVDRVRGSSVLLLDDVFTTGATASECAKALMRKGARSVDLLTIARALVEPVDV
jgi:ComF family protein